MTVPVRRHPPGHVWPSIVAVAVMTVLFFLFERTALWLALPIVVVALLPIAGRDLTPRELHWLSSAAAVVVVVAVLIWLT